jgi:outer membrane lipoprotein-sorting protein
MLFFKRLILAAGMCVAFVGVFAQTADEIIGKDVQAMGGKEKLSKLNSVIEETTTTFMGQDIPAKVWIVNEKGMRTEISIMGQKIITVMTRDTGWMVNPMMGGGAPQPLPSAQIKESASRMDLRGQLVDYATKGYVATLLGKEDVDGKSNFKIKLTKKGQQDFVFFIDASTYLVTKIHTVVAANGSSMNTDIVMSDYRKTPEGFVFPFGTTINVNPGGQVKSIVNKLTVNPTVPASVFLKP